MDLFLFGISIIGIPVGLVLLIILGVSVVLFFGSIMMYDSKDNEKKVEVASKTQEEVDKEKEVQQTKKEDEKKAKEEDKKAKEEEKKAKQEAKETEKEEKNKAKEDEKKAKEEAKLKEEQAAKEKEAIQKTEKETKAKSKEEEKSTKQKEYFIKNTQPAIDEWIKTYDQLWNGIWKPTFEAIGNGSRDVYTAYDNMKSLKEG